MLKNWHGNRASLSPQPIGDQGVEGFTLIELLVAVAIIGLLAMIALPAYNNYAVKSRFTEVVAATNPTKTAIAACVASGDCVSNGGIDLGGSISSLSVNSASTPNATNTSVAGVYATAYADLLAQGQSASQAASGAAALANIQQNFQDSGITPYAVASWVNGYACVMTYQAYASNPNQCGTATATVAQANQYLNAASNPYYASSINYINANTQGTANLPCVGSGAGNGCAPSTKYVSKVSFSANGIITATATSAAGLKAETFTLTPSYASAGRIDWIASGSCKTRSGGSLC